MSGQELQFIEEAFDSNFIAPLGPMVEAFEKEFARLAFPNLRPSPKIMKGKKASYTVFTKTNRKKICLHTSEIGDLFRGRTIDD